MPLITINAGSIYRLAIAELQTTLGATAPVLTQNEEDPADGSRFVRLHAIVMPERQGRPNDPDLRRVMVRATAQVPASDLRVNGLALHDLCHAAHTALAAKRLADFGHDLHFEDGFVSIETTPDESLRMRDGQITLPAIVTRTSGND